jgi:putative PIN family toxin of toxin-antitoxin system
MRAVIDTNVFVSGVLGGQLAAVLDLWRAGRFTLVVSDEIVYEYLEVLRRPKFALPPTVVESIGAYLIQKAEFVIPVEPLSVVVDDPKDDKFIEAAVAGEVDLIVSGDKHLLKLGTYRQIPISTARDFLDRLEKESSAPESPEENQ